MDHASPAPATIAFGRFRLVPRRRELWADGQPVGLGDRAYDVLVALIEARGAIVSKDALMARVWPNRIVEENNLQAQISALRAAFGAERDLIRTVSGRGYQFIGDIRNFPLSSNDPAGGAVEPESARVPTNLPEPLSDLIGRDKELREVLNLATAHRLVTLTGPGGIGKTRLGLATARELLAHFAEGIWLAELSPLSDPGLVPVTVAAAVGHEFGCGEISVQRVAQALADRRHLLVLDNCEHVIAAAAAMAEALLRTGLAVHIIATSREPLRAEGEQIYPVPPLPLPVSEGADPWQSGAVQLFTARARASGAQIFEDRHNAAVIAAICQRLDGIPLAIELAAARAAALGIEALPAHLDDRLHLLSRGRRTALPRHQTLRATLDWSYELLAEPERVILRRLSVFAGYFSLTAASAVVASPDISPSDVVESLLSLVAKSLVSAEISGPIAAYRLLDTTRAYAFEKLRASGEWTVIARRHAEFYRDAFERAESEWETRSSSLLSKYGWRIDNLRVALDWAFSPGGDASIGVELTTAAVPWMHLSLLDECHGRVEQALDAIRTEGNCDAAVEMKLHYASAATLVHVKGIVPEIEAGWTRVLDIAESLDDAEYQLRALGGLWYLHMARGENRAALVLARRFCARAAELHFEDQLIGERMIGASRRNLGDLASARRHIERTLPDRFLPAQTSCFVPFLITQRVMGRMHLAPILWLQGFPDQAVRVTEEGIHEAQAANHALSLCWVLAMAACPIALWTGDLAAAERYVGMLLDHSAKHELSFWRNWARRHQGELAIKRGDVINGLALLRDGFGESGDTASGIRITPFLGAMAEALGRAGQIADGLVAVDDALARTEETEGRWLIAELLRIQGELLLLQGAHVAAEDHFRQALGWARRQGALSWELRAATSLARLLRDQGRSADAKAMLQAVYDRFTEGFDTADHKAAREILLHL